MSTRNKYPITIEKVPPARKGAFRPRKIKTMASLTPTQKPATVPQSRGTANILCPIWLGEVLAYHAAKGRLPEADRVKILLSFHAGLRAREIIGLRMTDVTDACGKVGDLVRVRPRNAKCGRARAIPMHPELREAILAFRVALPGIEQFAVTRRDSTIQEQSIDSLTVWLHWMYKQAGVRNSSTLPDGRPYAFVGG